MPPLLLDYIEALLFVLVCGIGFAFPQYFDAVIKLAARAFSWICRRPRVAYLVAGLTPVALRLAVLPLFPVPVPSVHDDFSYLLTAETFSLGRITNLPHRFWHNFETIYVLQQPTYTGYYPPGTPAVLAAGIFFFGHPWVGVLIATALMYMALLWMLRGWLPPKWALAGVVMAFGRIGLVTFWMGTYLGGAAPAIGGALIIGALPRMLGGKPISSSFLMGLGLMIAANTRPYDACLLALPVAVYLLLWLAKNRRWASPARLCAILVPLSIMSVINLSIIGYYNWRVTGSATTIPYQHSQRQYGVPQTFLFQAPVVLTSFPNRQIKEMYEWQLQSHDGVRGHVLEFVFDKSLRMWQFAMGVSLSVLPFCFPLVYRRKKQQTLVRFLFVLVAFSIGGLMLYGFYTSAHLAMSLSAMLVLFISALRYLRTWKRETSGTGLRLSRCVLLTLALLPTTLVFNQLLAAHGPPAVANRLRRLWITREFVSPPWSLERAAIIRDLKAKGGGHLIFVRYPENHDLTHEWNYNSADIDGSAVVWAREVDPKTDRELIQYFQNRTVWILELGKPLRPYN